MNQKIKAFIALGIVCFFWGTTYIAMRTGVMHMPGLMLAAIRQLTGGLLLVGWFLIKGHSLPDRQTLIRLGIIGTLILSVGNGLVSWGEQTVPAGLTSILAALCPMCIVLFSVMLIRGTRISPLMCIGLLLGFAGIFVIFYPLIAGTMQTGFAFGAMIIIIAVLSWSLGSVYAARQKFSINIVYASGWEMLIGGLVLVIASLVSGQSIPLNDVVMQSWISIAYLIIFGSLLTFSAYQYALKNLPTTQVAIYAYINPIVALLLGWLLLNETLNWRILVGAVITLGGIFLVQYSFRKVKKPLSFPIIKKQKGHFSLKNKF